MSPIYIYIRPKYLISIIIYIYILEPILYARTIPSDLNTTMIILIIFS